MILKILFTAFVMAGVQSLDKAPMKKHSKGAEIRMLAEKSRHGNQNAFVGHLTVPAKGKVPLHQDQTEEYLYILEGQGDIWIDGKKQTIKPGDLVFMPAMAKVRFENGPQVMKVLQVFAGQGPEQKYDSWGLKMKPGVKNK